MEFALFTFAKIFLGVGGKAGGGGDGIIRRVNVGKVAEPGLVERFAEILHGKMHAYERAAGSENIFLVVEAGIFVGADGNIEFVAGVDAPESVETGFVEKNHAGGAFHDFLVVAGEVVLGADEIKIVVAFSFKFSGVGVELSHEFLRKITNSAVGVDEFWIDVAQEGAHPGKPVFEVKENRTTTDERLEIAGDFSWKKFVELGEKLRLAANPFQERLWFDGRSNSDGAESKLGVVEFVIRLAFGLIKRVGDFTANPVLRWFWIRSLI